MGLFGGPTRSLEEQEMVIAQKIAVREARKAKMISGAKFAVNEATNVARSVTNPQTRFAVGKNVGQAVLAGMQQGRATFSREQEMIGEMFGQGEHIWGTNNQPVTINNDLNPSQSDPWDETGSMFGFGGHSERSGLF